MKIKPTSVLRFLSTEAAGKPNTLPSAIWHRWVTG